MSKASFYMWKYVIRPNTGLSETIVHSSSNWFKNRAECVANAKSCFEDPTESTRRVIVKKTIPVSVDEIDVVTRYSQLENLFTLCYALELAKRVKRLAFELFLGCLIDNEESHHTCQLSSAEDITSRYFSIALRELDEDKVEQVWRDLVLSDPSLKDTQEFVMCHYQCVDFRNAQLKTEQWKENLKNQVIRLIKLEKNFVG